MKNNFIITYPAIFAGGNQNSTVNFFNNINNTLIDVAHCNESKRKLFVIDSNVENILSKLNSEHKNTSTPFALLSQDSFKSIIIPAGEKYKTMESVLSIINYAIKLELNRGDEFVAIGGGVVCDITAFAASIYKRGVAVNFVPTTLLAMVDAAIGGKCGCDNDAYKNMIGSFWPAKSIYYCSEFLNTLPNTEYLSGLAEAIKTALLYDSSLFELFENKNTAILSRDPILLDTIIKKCAAAKAAVVKKDFTEKNERRMLNLGHTFAHALETYEGLGGLSHGCAVGWGLTRVAILSQLLGFSNEDYVNKVTKLMSSYGYDTTCNAGHNDADFCDRIIDAMHKDKKNTNSKVTFVLQKDISNNVIAQVDDNIIRQVLQ